MRVVKIFVKYFPKKHGGEHTPHNPILVIPFEISFFTDLIGQVLYNPEHQLSQTGATRSKNQAFWGDFRVFFQVFEVYFMRKL
jgi:hypothetical protein